MPAPLPAPEPAPPLRLPDWPLPAYRYVPGLNPHPFRHPDGHLYTGGGAPAEAPWSPDTPWAEDRRYLRGLDLFDQRFYWEAHEVLEALWHFAPRGSADAALLQGLIQAAAALLKRHLGQPRAAERLLERAQARLADAAKHGPWQRGLHLPSLSPRLAEEFARGGWPLLQP